MSLTIFEGPDGAGKTRLIATLRPLLHGDASFVHHGAYADEKSIAVHYFKPMYTAWCAKRELVFDRSWVAEPIYGAVFRRGACRISVAQRRQLERLALTLSGVIVLALPAFETCRRAFLSRIEHEYLETERQLRGVYDLYKRAESALPVVTYNWQAESPSALCHRIAELRDLENNGPGAGRWAPGQAILLVGDRHNGEDFRRVPFAHPYADRGGCGAWLADKLEAWGVAESQLYWVNAWAADGRQTDERFIAELRPRGIIALGESAHKWCEQRGVKHAAVEHPQHWKRFHHLEEYTPLRAALTAIIHPKKES